MTSTTGQLLGSLTNIGNVHDVQLDYYSKFAAVATGAGTVDIFDITDGQQKPCGQLKGHEAPVWKVSWAHPKFGSLLASCSYDMKIIVWKQTHPQQWQQVHVDTHHTASVNDVKFAPWEFGLCLAAASSDGTISTLSYSVNDGQWKRRSFPAHPEGAQTLDWAPTHHHDTTGSSALRLVSGGCDNQVVVWKCEGETWSEEAVLSVPGHRDWVRDVAWKPTGISNIIASGSWDKTVIIWVQEVAGTPWRQLNRLEVPDKVEGLDWSGTGGMLAVTTATETVIYKEIQNGNYTQVGKAHETGFTDFCAPVESPLDQGDTANVFQDQVTEQNPEQDAQQAAVLSVFGL